MGRRYTAKRYKLNNRGSAIVTVLVVVAFITILATVMLYISGSNFHISYAVAAVSQSVISAGSHRSGAAQNRIQIIVKNIDIRPKVQIHTIPKFRERKPAVTDRQILLLIQIAVYFFVRTVQNSNLIIGYFYGRTGSTAVSREIIYC